MRTKWWGAAIATVALLVSAPWVAESHTAYQPRVRFVEEGFPERPIEEYTRGRLGIIQPAWERGYLVVAYRELSGRPLSVEERRSFLSNRVLVTETAVRADRPNEWKYHTHDEEKGWPQRWVRERAKYRRDKTPSPHEDDPYADKDWWKYAYDNSCGDDSFRTAIKTLRDRAKRYGSDGRELNRWIDGQDQVYLNCNQRYGYKTSATIPQELPSSAGTLAKADRAYQIAAAHFYGQDYAEAERRFEAIGNDATSPWQELGRYLACRMALRQVMPDDLSTFDRAALVAVELRLTTYIRSARDPELKRSAEGLVEYIALRLRPHEELVRLSERVSKGQSGGRFAQEIIDVGFLMDRQVGEQPDFPGIDAWTAEYERKAKEWKDGRYPAVKTARESADLVDWLMTLQWGTKESASHAYQRWKAARSLTWLVAAVSTATGKENWSKELISAAAQVPETSKAFLTVSYHRARLLREAGEQDKARAVLEHLLISSVDASSVNLLKEQRGLASQSLEDYLKWVERRPVGYTNNTKSGGYVDYCEESHWGCDREVFEAGNPARLLPQMSDDTALAFSHQLPLTMMIEAGRSSDMPANLRARVLVAAWARAVMLDRVGEAASLKAEVLRARPEMRVVVEEYARAKTPEERRFLAAYAIAHFPGLRPTIDGESPRVTRFDWADNFRDNWWCKGGGEDQGGERDTKSTLELSFLTSEQKNAAKKEDDQLFRINVGDRLANTLIDWAKSHRDDPRSAEALYYAMRVMRFSCDGSTKRSREVYLLLHQRYPKTVWAKKTRAWYSN